MGKYLGGLVQTHAKGVPTFLDDTTEKFDDEFETSPFVSTSTSRKTGKSYARGGFLEQANPNIRHGILVTSRAPKIASISTYNKEPIQFDEKGREITHPHIPALSDVRTNHPEEYEMLLPGIIDPRSVDKIEIYDGLFPIKDTSVEPQVIVHRSFIDSSEVITIVNYRGSSEGEKKQYVMNDTTGKFELVTKQHDTHLALAA